VGLFDEAPLEAAEEAAEATEEKEHVLVPVESEAPEEGEESPASPGGSTRAEDVLLEAGRLILDENRVAVSMIQRRFQLDFEQACEVLDRLQELGLIGPYVGGRNRDILLTPEQWESMSSEMAAS
jgi:S-DNA-T family DNA segregation ATPase FtsK/SpoIIIE